MAKGSLRVNGIIVDTDGEIKASTGDAIVIREDDGSAVITVDTSGNTLINGDTFIGGNTAAETLVAGTPRVQLEGLGYADSSLSIFNNSNDSNGSYLYFGKSRGTALSADTIVQDGDFVGGMEWVAADGTDRGSRIAAIYGVVDGTPGANDTPGELLFFTTADGANSGTQRMVIKADGNVGIGTTAPSNRLTVAGTGGTNAIAVETYTTNAAHGSQLLLARSNNGTLGTQTAVDADDLLGEISFQGNNGSSFVAGSRISGYADETHSGTAAGSTLRFYTADNTTNTLDERVRIDNNGNVGIGTTNPSPGLGGSDVTLEIAGATSPSLTINDTGQAEKYSLYADSNDFKIGYGTTTLTTFQNDGNVGIGTTAPDALLHLLSSTSLNPILKIENTNADQHNAQIHLIKRSASEADDDYLGQIDFKGLNDGDELPTYGRIQGIAKDVSDGTEDGRVYISAMNAGTLEQTFNLVSGRVGIGTTAPDSDALLHVKTSTNSENLLVESTEAGASTSGFGINLYRNSASAADNDVMSNIRFIGKNDAGSPEDITYAQMYAQIVDASDGTEDGSLFFQTVASGTLSTSFAAYADGIYFPQGGHYILGGAKMLSGTTDIVYVGHSYMYTVYFGRWSSNSDYHFSKRVISAAYGDGTKTSSPWTEHSIGTQSIATAYDNSGYKLKATPSVSAGTFYFFLQGQGYTKPYLL